MPFKMLPSFIGDFTLRECVLLAALIFLIVLPTDFVDAAPCEVTYSGNDLIIRCRKIEESHLKDLNRTHHVHNFKCDGAEAVYPVLEFGKTFYSFEINDCALTADTFNFCKDCKIVFFRKAPGNYKNAVLRNGTFRNHRGMGWIQLSGNGIQSVESGAFGCRGGPWTLNMSNNYIESLPDDDFRCMCTLATLDLSNNRISVLPKCLGDLPSLFNLHLSDNSITVFPETALHKSATLHILDLSRNGIQRFCPAEITQLVDLNELYLRGNNITSLKKNCFAERKNLITLDIGLNNGLTMAKDVFSGLYMLEELYIDGCGLSIGVEEGTIFSNTTKLEKLRLQRNDLREIHSDLFRNLHDLQHLDLSFNAISVLQDGCFAGNERLQYLDLSNNILSEIKCDDFPSMNNLILLNLCNNNITNVAENAFRELTNLKTLNISNNNISSIMPHSSNPVHPFEHIFQNLERLEILDMSNVTSMNCTLTFLEGNKNIKKLDVSFNVGLRLERRSLNSLKNLRTFISKGTNVSSLEYLFEYHQELEEINISRNKIQLIGYFDLFEVKNLRQLDLSWNNIHTIDDRAFRECGKIEFVNLSHNALQFINVKDMFKENSRLKVLDISSNRFSRIYWKDFTFVDNLRASNNTFNELILSDFVDTSLQTVHLEDCKISKVHLDPMPEMENGTNFRRTEIFLARNPLVCDCRAFQLYEYVKRPGVSSRFLLEGLTCRRPVELEGREMRNLLPGDFICEVNTSCPKTCHCLKRAHDDSLVVNCSRKGLRRLPDEAPANTTLLDVSYNNITSLESLNSSVWENLTEIRAEGNFISSLEFEIPKNVKIVLLHGNRLTKLPENQTAFTRRDLHISLSENPWPCSCESLELKRFLSKHAKQIIDYMEVRCIPASNSTSNLTLREMTEHDLCPNIFCFIAG